MSVLTLDYLDWDSEQLGVPCGMINLSNFKPSPASREIEAQIIRLIEQNSQLVFITVKLISSYISSINKLIDIGARLIDTELTFISSGTEFLHEGRYRFVFCKETNSDPFIPLAEEMQFSRFFLDSRIPNDKALHLWQTSIINHCKGLADRLLVAFCDDRPCGIVAMKFGNKKDLILTIVGVLKEYQRKGVGRQMLGKITERYGDNYQILVETQSINLPAQKLYHSAGFKYHGMTYNLHYWRS
jgi:ribosomal protein S18 acetylase RimI-like enzyme